MPNDRMAGNKGEWSELYTLFRLLGEGRLYAANEYAERNDDVFYPLVKVFREEEPGDNVEYVINRETQSVDIVYRNHRYGTVSQETFREEASILLSEIRANKSSFEVDSVAQFSNGILIYKIKAPSSDKTDISSLTPQN